MKFLFACVAVILLSYGMVFSQTGVPQEVLAAFKAKYQAAKNVEWGKESDNEFEAEFSMNGKQMTASFDAKGKWLETEIVLSTDQLPAKVISTLQTQFGHFEVKKSEMLQKAGEPVVFEIKLENTKNLLAKKINIIIPTG